MKIRINGDHRDFTEPLTLAELITTLGMKADRVAVELNREIVQRTKWSDIALREGDKLEIVHFVGGGSCRGQRCRGNGGAEDGGVLGATAAPEDGSAVEATGAPGGEH